MTKDEALKIALEALEEIALAGMSGTGQESDEAMIAWHARQAWKFIGIAAHQLTAIKEALAQPEQKYHRGDRLICLETEEYCVIHISGTDRQWVKFPDSHIGVYTNEQVAELFELLPKEPEQTPVAWMVWGEDNVPSLTFKKPSDKYVFDSLYTAPPQRKPLTDEMVVAAARVLNERQADACGVDRDDQWAIYCDDFKADARAMLEAAHGIKGKA